MEKIRLQNDKIKEKRERVRADEDAFNVSVENEAKARVETIAAERARAEVLRAKRAVEATLDRERQSNAQKKLEKIGAREWDSGKERGEWKQDKRPIGDNKQGARRRGRLRHSSTSQEEHTASATDIPANTDPANIEDKAGQ